MLLVGLSACTLPIDGTSQNLKSGLITMPETDQAFRAQRDLLDSEEMKQLVELNLVNGVVVDATNAPVSLEVNVNKGTYNGTDSASYVAARLPRHYDGIPVSASSDSLDTKLPAFGILLKPSDNSR